jgi:hypothetical protein
VSSTPSASSTRAISNTGSRRVVVGPPAKSKGGGAMLKFDTSADAGVPASKRIGSTHKLEGTAAKGVRESKVVAALKDRLGLRME